MKNMGFVCLCGLAGIVFALIQEFKWRCTFAKRYSCENKKNNTEVTSYDAIIAVLMNLLAIIFVMGILKAYTWTLHYSPSTSVVFIGFIALAIAYVIFRRGDNGGNGRKP